MTNTPPESHHMRDNLTLNMNRRSPRRPAEPIHCNWTTNPPPATISTPRQIFNADGTRKYLNIRPAGGQPFPLKKGKKYLAEDYKDGVKVKKESKAGPRSPERDRDISIEQEASATSREPSSVDPDSSPERPLIDVLRSTRKYGERIEDLAIGVAEVRGDTGEDERGRKMGRDTTKRKGGTRSVKRHGQ